MFDITVHTVYISIFKFNHNLFYSIDAYKSSGLGRFANDASGSLENCLVRKVVLDKIPHLCLYAKRIIKDKEEIRYDYGNEHAPWRVRIPNFILTPAIILN